MEISEPKKTTDDVMDSRSTPLTKALRKLEKGYFVVVKAERIPNIRASADVFARRMGWKIVSRKCPGGVELHRIE
jgi:hypothetical protein